MQSQTVRIAAEDHAALIKLSEESGKPMSAVLGEAIHTMTRIRLLQQTNSAYARLKGDSEAWQEMREERVLWESVLPECGE